MENIATIKNNPTTVNIPLVNENGEGVGLQQIKVEGNNIVSFFNGKDENSAMFIDLEKGFLAINNSIVPNDTGSPYTIKQVSNIKIDSKGNLTFSMKDGDSKVSYLIDGNSISQKKQGEKEYSVIKTFENPLNINLPKNLFTCENQGKLNISSLPSQFFGNFLNDNYGFTSFASKDGKLLLAKGPDNTIYIRKDSSMFEIPSENGKTPVDFFDNAIGFKYGPKGINGKASKGLGFYLSSKEEVKEFGQFILGRELKDTEIKSVEEQNIQSLDFAKNKKLGETVKQVRDDSNKTNENINELPNHTTNIIGDKPLGISDDPKPVIDNEKLKSDTSDGENGESGGANNGITDDKNSPSNDNPTPENGITGSEPKEPSKDDDKNMTNDTIIPEETQEEKDKKKKAIEDKDQKATVEKRKKFSLIGYLLVGIDILFITAFLMLGGPMFLIAAFAFASIAFNVLAYSKSDACKVNSVEDKKQSEARKDKRLAKQKDKQLKKDKKTEKKAEKKEKQLAKQDNKYNNKVKSLSSLKDKLADNKMKFLQDQLNYKDKLDFMIKETNDILNNKNLKLDETQKNALNKRLNDLQTYKDSIKTFNYSNSIESSNNIIANDLKNQLDNKDNKGLKQSDLVFQDYKSDLNDYCKEQKIEKPDLANDNILDSIRDLVKQEQESQSDQQIVTVVNEDEQDGPDKTITK